MAVRSATLTRDGRARLVLTFSDEDGRAAVKAAGARWQPEAKAWDLPLLPATAKLLADLRVAADEALTAELEPLADLHGDVLVTARRNRIEIDFRYSEALKNEIKDAGARFDADHRVWWAPLSEAEDWALLARRRRWAVTSEVRATVDALEAAEVASRAVDTASVDLNLPESFAALHPYQRAGVAAARGRRATLLADEMGLGKSVQALATAEVRDTWPAIVVCPTSLRLVWQAEIAKWMPNRTSTVVTGQKTPLPSDFGMTDLVIIGWDVLAPRLDDLLSIHPNAVIFDEFHAAKERNSKRSKAAFTLARSVPSSGLVLGLTGTPVLSRPAELASPLQILGTLDQISPSVKSFLVRFCGGMTTNFGFQAKGATNTDELHDLLRKTCMVRRTKSQVMAELPPLTVAEVPLVVAPADARERNEAENVLLELLSGPASREEWEARCAQPDEAIIVALTAARKAAGIAKIPAAIRWVEEMMDTDEKVIVWAHHKAVQQALAEHFAEQGAWLRGGQDRNEAMAEAERFQHDPECRVLVASISSAKEGWTLTAATNAAILEEPWRPADIDQAVARCYGRASDPHGATAWHLFDPSSALDRLMVKRLAAKAKVVAAVTDGVTPEMACDEDQTGVRTAVLRELTAIAHGYEWEEEVEDDEF